jgi:hypothetical protein
LGPNAGERRDREESARGCVEIIAPGSAGRIAALEEAGAAHPTTAGEAQSTSTRVRSTSRVGTMRHGHIVPGAKTMFDIWVTQFYQGQTEGSGSPTWRYGGKLDAFLKVDAQKLGLWPGFHVNVQYEHYFGQNINKRDFALIPVNTALAYVECDGYHTALSVSVTQDFGEYISVSAGKFNMMTLASKTIDRPANKVLANSIRLFSPAVHRVGSVTGRPICQRAFGPAPQWDT